RFSGQSGPGPDATRPGPEGAGLTAGQVVTPEHGDVAPSVPPSAAAARALPVCPGGHESSLAAGAAAGAAPAEWRQPDRPQPQDEADDRSDNRAGADVVHAHGQADEHRTQNKNPPHASDGASCNRVLQ